MLHEVEQGHIDTLIVMENDLLRRAPSSRIKAALAKVQQLIVLDHQQTELVQMADWVLPASTFAEADGTLINNEGRAQRFFQVFDPSFYDTTRSVKESWHWLHVLINPDPPSNGLGRSWMKLSLVVPKLYPLCTV